MHEWRALSTTIFFIRGPPHEWIVPESHDFLASPDGYMVPFVYFHNCGLATPVHHFLLGLLHYYKIMLQHLNPNGIRHIAAFIVLCKGYLGIEPHFDLWWYFFCVGLHMRREHGRSEVTTMMGCVGIRLRKNRAKDNISMKLAMSNKGRHSQWFYLKNDAVPSLPKHALPKYTGRVIEVVPESWGWGVPKKHVKRITDHLTAIKILREADMKGSRVIGTYHARRVVPLMARTLLMHRMVPIAQLEGMVLAEGPLADLEIVQCLKKAMDA
jgi:hypothetical protein